MAKPKIKHRPLERFDLVNICFLIFITIIILVPFYNAIMLSFVDSSEASTKSFILFPKTFNLDSYNYVLENENIGRGYINTIFITFVGTIYSIVLTILCAYALSKPIPGRNFFTYLIVFTMYATGGIIPYYLLVDGLRLTDTLWASIIPLGVQFGYMVIIRRWFQTLPSSIMEAAYIDGANEAQVLWHVVLPLSKPIIATMILFYAVDRWNEWWHGMLFISDSDKQPLQLILRNIILDAGSSAAQSGQGDMSAVAFGDGIKMASIVLTMLPIMLLYPFAQKYFVRGLLAGGEKG